MIFRKILIAVEPGPLATITARTGLKLAQAAGSQAMLVYVVDTSRLPTKDFHILDPYDADNAELLSRAEDDGRRFLAKCRRLVRLRRRPTETVCAGEPVAEVAKQSKQWAADLIVIGNHRRKGIEHLLLGSVAEKVIQHASCAVLVVRDVDHSQS